MRLNSIPDLVDQYHRETGLKRSQIRKAIAMSLTPKGQIDISVLNKILKRMK